MELGFGARARVRVTEPCLYFKDNLNFFIDNLNFFIDNLNFFKCTNRTTALWCPSCLPRGVLFQGLLDGDEVLQALGHLEALDVEVARVQEVVHPLPAVVLRFGLVGQKKKGGGAGNTTNIT